MSAGGAGPGWTRVKALFAEALELPPADRPAFLDEACGADRTLREEIASLLASHEAALAQGFIRDPAVPMEPAEPEPSLEGRTIGPYRLLSEIGRGGMGAVYRAVRADDQYEKQVAIKVVRRSFDSELVVRFRAERQILAGLDHPGIARLLDGGSTPDGLPYLVMDYVVGEPLTDFAESRKLPVRERLRLFREVCAAVHYAHQKLVVHRDLKPSNILVTSEGSPHLLDFGIAKLLSPEPSEMAPTATLLGPMTPEYASPEQVRGQAITTATDVYSLGVLLCELLTGQRPYCFATRDPEELARVITTAEPSRPSAMARQFTTDGRERYLEGDLDNIVLMALRKEPQRRYASVDQLSEDIRRHLEGRPVIARPDTLRYRASKFVHRNRGLVAAAVAVGLSLVGGLVATAWQARVARRERALAQQRFEDVRVLARSFLFEFNDAIEKLPGSTEARQLLVTRGLEYLDRLARQGADPGLQRELGRGYLRLGDLQGRPNYANLGDTAGALASYRKALAQHRALAAADPNDPVNRHDLTVALNRMGTLLDAQGDLQGAVAAQREALALAEGLVAAAPDDVDELRALLIVNTKLGDLLMRAAEPAEALVVFEKALPRYQAVASRTGIKTDRFNVVVAHARVGNGLAALGRHAEALASFERARMLIQAVVDEDPHDAPARRSLAVTLNKIGDELLKTGDPKGALLRFREALALREALAPADPKNMLVRSDLVGSYVRIGDLLDKANDPAGAADQYRLALPILDALCAKDPGSPAGAAADRAGVLARLADVETRMGRTAQALATFAVAVAAFEASLRVDPKNMESQYDLAATLLGQGRSLEQHAAQTASLEAWRKARTAFSRSLELWRGLGDREVNDSRLEVGSPADNLRAAQAGLARCDERLRSAEGR